MSVESQASVIHDIGYQRYDGPRLGRAYAVRSLYSYGLRTSFGLGRSAAAKIFPWIVVGIVMLIATVLTVIRSQTGTMPVEYYAFPSPPISLLAILFCAVVAPELVSRDLRSGVLSLYFSRQLTRADYPFAKWASLVTAVFLLLFAPMLLMYVGGAFSVSGFSAEWHEFLLFSKGIASAAMYALVFASLALLVASLAGRRAVAAAMTIAVFLVTTPIYGVLIAIAYQGSHGELPTSPGPLFYLAGLVSPMTLVGGVATWLFDPNHQQTLGDYGPVYAGVALALVVACVGLLLLRYRRVAR
jgi:ABC-2 type transport system permease protein